MASEATRPSNRRRRFFKFALPLGGLLLAAAFALFATRPSPGMTPEQVDEAVKRALAAATPVPSMASQAFAIIAPSVVRIELERPGPEESGRGVGSGVLVDERGLILTAYHVIAGADSITVVFSDGSESEAVVLAEEPENDTAVIRAMVVPDDVIAATLVSSATLRIGDEVVAVGSPYGLTHSVSAGVVSGLRRTFRAPAIDQTLDNVIQFDAAVNPGNSGGPLVNRNGEVVGIVSGLLNPKDEVFIGIGFAVPIETAAGAAGPPWE